MTPLTHAGKAPASIDCGTTVRRLWDYLDGRLPSMTREEVEVHLAICAGCPPHFEFARAMKRALAAAGSPDILPDEEARLRELVHDALRRLDGDDGDDGRASGA